MQNSGKAKVNNTQLYYEMEGNGYPLVLIHGGGVGRKIWDHQIAVFAKQYQTLRYDCRGYGQSARVKSPFSAADDLGSLLDLLTIDTAMLIGSSAGGGIALDFAIQNPNRITALVLVGPAVGGYEYSEATHQRNRGFFEAYQTDGTAGLVQAMLDDPYFPPALFCTEARQELKQFLINNAHIFEQDWRLQKGLDPPAVQRLDEVCVPTLILVGERDDKDNQEITALLEREIAGAERIIVRDAGHLIQLEKPEKFNQIVLEFLNDQAM